MIFLVRHCAVSNASHMTMRSNKPLKPTPGRLAALGCSWFGAAYRNRYMPRLQTFILVALLSGLCMVSCASSAVDDIAFHVPVLTAQEILTRSSNYLAEHGTDIGEYDLLLVAFDYFKGEWIILWSYKKPTLGGTLLIHCSNEADPVFSITGGA